MQPTHYRTVNANLPGVPEHEPFPDDDPVKPYTVPPPRIVPPEPKPGTPEQPVPEPSEPAAQ